ncbi:Conserved protein containing a Zn-ribbon-like motif, possibly RNA-binding [Brevibacterium casei]|nr:ABATE domain-containing protein [Brevibacterium sp. XM4083]MCM1013163.1 ABATE domain-containing protein [Brevibacterium sp. XM4083]PAK97357.1 hypothetical protein B8X04_01910 [Brevibacterium casei]VEW10910.1 Conserved protein containing a Zn-ribbon-like motif, possibly RNA-binding [Brevibacterium casei]
MNRSEKWIWLGDHLAVDFANTTIGREFETVDLIATVEDAHEWIDLEPTELPKVEITDENLPHLRALRDAAGRTLRAAVREEEWDPADTALINSLVETGRVFRLLGSRPRGSRLTAGDGFAAFAGVLAASVVDLLGRDDLAAIAICEAPGCGQIFHRSRVNQKWCSPGCGNRARVDRHRHRNPHAQRRAAVSP